MELPFLYQTRTILRLPNKRTCNITRHAVQHGDQRGRRNLSFTTPDFSSFIQRKAAAVAAANTSKSDQINTLSAQERRIFQRLHSLQDSQEMNARLGTHAPDPDQLDVNPERILALFTPQQSPPLTEENMHADHLIEPEEVVSAPKPISHPLTETTTHQICLGEIKEFTKAARQALQSGIDPGDLALYSLLETRVLPLIDVLGLKGNLRYKASRQKHKKTSAANASATSSDVTSTDGSVAKSTAPSSPKAKNAHPLLNIPALIQKHAPHLAKPSPSLSTPAPDSDSPPPEPQHQPSPLALLTRLYPALLLITLRLLVLHHPLSPITSSLLPQIRALGPSSYILGATTPFFNTHMLSRWRVYSDLAEVDSLLHEMERGGTEFDLGTLRVLKGIAKERSEDLAGTETTPDAMPQESRKHSAAAKKEQTSAAQSRGADFWLAPAQQQRWSKIEEWRNLIERRLEEKGMGEVYREDGSNEDAEYRPSGDITGGEDLRRGEVRGSATVGIGGQEIEVPRVWL